jgi:S1-C subfamily serine protease
MKPSVHFAGKTATLLASAFIGWASGQTADQLAPEQLFEKLAPSVWTVETFDDSNRLLSGGSGVVVGPGSVVTNCHVLVKASRVIVARENVSYGATLEHPDPERDLCLLKIRNFTAPAVAFGDEDALKIGVRVYAIGSPRGLEQTISDGLLSGVRRSSSGDFTALQVTVPISPGSSGGGLFDAQGRLIGITTFSLREGQNLNFALPARWIAEVPSRAQAALASRRTGDPTGRVRTPMGSAGQSFEYRLTDRLTGNSRTVVYRVDGTEGEEVSYNQGTRIENTRGEVLRITSAPGGDADAAMPPGGWVHPSAAVGAVWEAKYRNVLTTPAIAMELKGRIAGEETLDVAGRKLRTLRAEYTGFSMRGFESPCGGPYSAMAWYAPELKRVVRFEVRTQGCSMASKFVVDEILELTAIR